MGCAPHAAAARGTGSRTGPSMCRSHALEGWKQKHAGRPDSTEWQKMPLANGTRRRPTFPLRRAQGRLVERLIAKVYETDPMACPRCGASMKVLAVANTCPYRSLRDLSPPFQSPPFSVSDPQSCASTTAICPGTGYRRSSYQLEPKMKRAARRMPLTANAGPLIIVGLIREQPQAGIGAGPQATPGETQ